MKVLILHPSSRYDRYLPDIPAAGRMELVFTDREGPEERWLAAGGDAEALVAAPVTPVTEELIARMPHLKLIHSDGVGYDRIDLAAAREGGHLCVQLRRVQRRPRGGAGGDADEHAAAPDAVGRPDGAGRAAA